MNVLCHIRPFHLLNEVDFMQSLPYNVDSLPFAQRMSYTANGRITRKATNARILNGNHSYTKNINFSYHYERGSNKLSFISDAEQKSVPLMTFRWDGCGNMLNTEISLDVMRQNYIRTHTWTEDNRLQTVADISGFSCYRYDAAGDRTYKLTWDGRVHTVNGRREVYYTPQNATLYASPYLVATPQGYTKHYYAGAERITSQLGRGKFDGISASVVDDSLVQAKLQAVTGNVRYPVTLTAPSSSYFSYLDTLTNRQNDTFEAYWYHTDHLGSSSWITYSDGSAVQHLHYLPFGEDFVNKKSSSFEGARYTFSAKEKDAETKYSYFGARYYSSDLSIWLSVDPMASKYPSLSPYVYCANNPIKLVDPNGEDIITIHSDGSYSIKEKKGRDVLVSTESFERKKLSAHGVFREHVSQEMNKNDEGKMELAKTTFTGLGKDDAQTIFNFLGDHTQVEWGYLESENPDGSRSYFVGSSHNEDEEPLVSSMTYDNIKVLRYDHSHRMRGYNDLEAHRYSKKDIDFWNEFTANHPDATAGIRVGGKTTIYYKNGVKTDAYFNPLNQPK